MGTIYRRGNVYWVKYYQNGKPHAESSHGDKMSVAKTLLKKREGEIAKGELPGIYFDRVRFDDLAEDFLADYRINGRKTLDNAEQAIVKLRGKFGGMRVPSITTARISEYIEERRAEGMANATINRELSALKRMLKLGLRTTPPKVGQMPYIPKLEEKNTRKGFFEHGEFHALRDALPDYLRPVVTFAYHSGWRRAEILGLTWEKVDLKAGIIRLDPGETKNDEARTLYLDAELSALMQQLVATRRLGCPYVFHVKKQRIGESQKTWKIGEFRKTWKTACIKVGLCEPMRDDQGKPVLTKKGKVVFVPTRIFHDFRRTAVRNMIRSGIPERVAMVISGHKTRSIFDRYNIVSEEDLKQAAMKQENYLKAQNGYNLVTVSKLSTGKKAGKMAQVVDFVGADGES